MTPDLPSGNRKGNMRSTGGALAAYPKKTRIAMSEQLNGTRELPKFNVREERNDRYVQVRLQEVQNGFIVRSGDVPIYYPSINEAAEAICEGLKQSDWRKD